MLLAVKMISFAQICWLFWPVISDAEATWLQPSVTGTVNTSDWNRWRYDSALVSVSGSVSKVTLDPSVSYSGALVDLGLGLDICLHI